MLQPIDRDARREILRAFLEEDIGRGDVTTLAIVPIERKGVGYFVAKTPLVLAGIDVAIDVLTLLDEGWPLSVRIVMAIVSARASDLRECGGKPGRC